MDRSLTTTPTPSEASTISASNTTSTTTSATTASLPSQTPAPKTSNGHPYGALERNYPLPTEEIDVAEALDRAPLRWTIKGTMAAGERRKPPRTPSAEEKAAAFAQAKAELLAASVQLNSRPSSRG